MGFIESPRFPDDISYGSRGGPGWKTSITELPSGAEQRVARWQAPRHRYDAAYGVKSMASLASLRTFYLAVGAGAANGFRFKDWFDFTSNPTDPTQPKGTADQQIGIGNGTTTTFQLKKRYASGSNGFDRIIEKPVSGTVGIWKNGAIQASGWTVNTTTGIVTFTTAPSNGDIIAASFEFDVPVRFGNGTDNILEASYDAFDDGSASVDLIEIINPNHASSDWFHGGSQEVAITANYTASFSAGMFLGINASSGLSVTLPPTTDLPTGLRIGVIMNRGSNSFTLKDPGGTTLCTIASGELVDCHIANTALGAGPKVWVVC